MFLIFSSQELQSDPRRFFSRHFLAMVVKSESRRSKGEVTSSSSRIGKTDRKQLAKKSLSSEFELVSEESRDLSPVSEVSGGVYCADPEKKRLRSDLEPVLKDNLKLSLVSEVSSGSHSDESLVVDTSALTSPDTFSLAELTPTSHITTDTHADSEDRSAKYTRCGDSAYSKVTSVEADVVVEHLKYALLGIQRSAGINNRSKKLVDTLIKTVVEEFYGIPEESDMLSKIIRAKTHVVATCLVLWMICTLLAVYVKCHTNIPFRGPLPT